MKIGINGDIIDTDNIYKIDSQCNRMWYDHPHNVRLQFKITSFNNNVIEVDLPLQIYLNNQSQLVRHTNNGNWDNDEILKENATHEDFENHPDYISIYNKLEAFRLSIVDAWKGNQSVIPQFNLE